MGAMETIHQLSAREQRQQRKRWILNTKAYGERKHRQGEAVSAVDTQSHSPTEDEVPGDVVIYPQNGGRPKFQVSQT